MRARQATQTRPICIACHGPRTSRNRPAKPSVKGSRSDARPLAQPSHSVVVLSPSAWLPSLASRISNSLMNASRCRFSRQSAAADRKRDQQPSSNSRRRRNSHRRISSSWCLRRSSSRCRSRSIRRGILAIAVSTIVGIKDAKDFLAALIHCGCSPGSHVVICARNTPMRSVLNCGGGGRPSTSRRRLLAA